MPEAFLLSDMTWEDAQKAVARAELAIIPTGSFEQHGPHLTFETDTVRAYNFGKLLAQQHYPRVLLSPPVTFGVSYHHMKFPGTITLRAETFQAIVYDVVWSLREHGMHQFILLNGHGGNVPSLNVVMGKLRRELEVNVAWMSFTSLGKRVSQEKIKSPIKGHACENETSQAMYLAPHLVRRERIVPGAIKGYPYALLNDGNGYLLNSPYTFDEITSNGALGDATLATEELGREIIEEALQNAGIFLNDFMDKNKASRGAK